jgi:23S rRNA pseudouridine955/2504/2580 synthase
MHPSDTPSAAPKARIVEIDASRAGQRIDNFLQGFLRGVPKSRVYRMLRTGEVRVNKGRIKASYRLQAGDAVRIPPVRESEASAPVNAGSQVLQRLERSILLEDKGLLILNKPSGLAVHGGSGLNYGVIEALRQLRPDAPFLELVHRLDRDTSGCLIIAKRRSVLRALHRLLREDTGMDKRYLALVKGRWQGGQRRVDAPLLKNTLRSGERVVRVSDEGKAALSLFRPVTVFEDCSLVEVRLMTGRTHQIRVHAASIGHPIAGDDKYGDSAFNAAMKARGLSRLFLHARSLAFTLSNEETGWEQDYAVNAPLDTALQAVLDSLAAAVDAP